MKRTAWRVWTVVREEHYNERGGRQRGGWEEDEERGGREGGERSRE